jgi:hypothetical protein
VPVKPDCYAIGFVVLWALMKNVEGGLSFAWDLYVCRCPQDLLKLKVPWY